jgi:hypothetical protein
MLDPSCIGNTPRAVEYAQEAAAAEYVQAVAPGSASVLGAAAAVVRQLERAESGASAAAVDAPETTSPPPAPPPAAVAEPPGPVAGAGTADGATTRNAVHAARPMVAAGMLLAVPAMPRAAEPGDSGEPFDPVIEVADSQTVPAEPQFASLVSGTVPVDLTALQRGVDQFFTQLEALGQELPKGPVLLRLAPWFLAAAAATAGLEVARWQLRRQDPRRLAWIVRRNPEEA